MFLICKSIFISRVHVAAHDPVDGQLTCVSLCGLDFPPGVFPRPAFGPQRHFFAAALEDRGCPDCLQCLDLDDGRGWADLYDVVLSGERRQLELAVEHAVRDAREAAGGQGGADGEVLTISVTDLRRIIRGNVVVWSEHGATRN